MTRLGIDLDTWKLTLCAVSDEVVLFETAPLRSRGHSLFDAIQAVPSALYMAIGRLKVVPDEVYIERGRGQHRTADFELGAIYGATAVAVKRALPDAHVETVTVSEWKKVVTAAVGIETKKGVPGNGNAPKQVANDACYQLLARRGFAFDGARLSPDELDAFGIAVSIEMTRVAAA